MGELREAPRDQAQSAFTPILRRFMQRYPGLNAVVFVDSEGECVDYCSTIDAYETKVAGAAAMVMVDALERQSEKRGLGATHYVHFTTDSQEVVALRVGFQYLLVVLTDVGGVTARLIAGFETLSNELHREADTTPGPWERPAASLRVETRAAVGWSYAPTAYHDFDGKLIEVSAVLGRWTETTFEGKRYCFRVRTLHGEEVTLAHDEASDCWRRIGRKRRTMRPGASLFESE